MGIKMALQYLICSTTRMPFQDIFNFRHTYSKLAPWHDLNARFFFDNPPHEIHTKYAETPSKERFDPGEGRNLPCACDSALPSALPLALPSALHPSAFPSALPWRFIPRHFPRRFLPGTFPGASLGASALPQHHIETCSSAKAQGAKSKTLQTPVILGQRVGRVPCPKLC
jgi:hypothetical protein